MSERRFFPLVVLGIVLGLVGLTVGAFVLVSRVAFPPADPDNPAAVFEQLRLTDDDVADLGLTASNGGLQSSSLSLAVAELEAGWRTWHGTPESCLLVGSLPGTSGPPLLGTESEADPAWKQRVISSAQTLLSHGEPAVLIVSRIFDDESAALEYATARDTAIASCGEFTLLEAEGSPPIVTSVEPYGRPELELDNGGWMATTLGWAPEPTLAPESIYDVQTRVLELRQLNVVTRIAVVTAPNSRVDAFMDDLAALVSQRLLRAVR